VDVESAIRTQRVVRRFSPQPIDDATLEAILNAGRRAGSSKNLQRWSFIVVRDRDRLEALAGVGHYADHLAGAALAIALVTPNPSAGGPHSILWDLGRAAQNMTLLAWARGIGSVPATVYDQPLCRSLLGYPADQHCEYLLSFGYPSDREALTAPPRAGGRRPLDELVHHETWRG
jgi:nitroreductase